MSRNLVAKTEVSSYRARALVRTEPAYIHEMSTYDAYQEAGIEKYRYLATLDRQTSKICQELDGKVFEIDKKEIRVNYPPMHPNCRSTTIAYIEGVKGQRLARFKGLKYNEDREYELIKEKINTIKNVRLAIEDKQFGKHGKEYISNLKDENASRIYRDEIYEVREKCEKREIGAWRGYDDENARFKNAREF